MKGMPDYVRKVRLTSTVLHNSVSNARPQPMELPLESHDGQGVCGWVAIASMLALLAAVAISQVTMHRTEPAPVAEYRAQ